MIDDRKNTGYSNTGYSNTGNSNTGNWNAGDWNTGDCNTGRWSTGNWNTGYWNTCNGETGYFNTIQSKEIRVFNAMVSVDAWDKASKPSFLYFELTEWVSEEDMTDQEKADNDTFRTTGGYLKSYEYKDAFQKSYNEASQEDKDLLLKLPNFDAAVFKEISGIDVNAGAQACDGKTVVIDGVEYELKVKK